MLNGNSPYNMIFNRKCSLNHLRAFGCLCFATVLNNHDKFSSRSEKCVLVGYASFKKGYKLFSLERKQFLYSRDVDFFENVFPFKTDSVIKTCQDLDHTNFFDKVVYEDLDMPYDEKNINDRPSDDGNKHANSPSVSKNSYLDGSPTIDPSEDELGHPQGSNGSAPKNEVSATLENENAHSEDISK